MNIDKVDCLLTGASGFLGKTLSDALRKQNLRIVGEDLFGRDKSIDLQKPFTLDTRLKIDLVIHAAGKAHIIPSNQLEEQAFYDVNFEGTKNLCQALSELDNPPKAFIFISTVAVYGLESGNLIREEHPLEGSSPYARSKILAEEWLLKWSDHHNIKLGILRLPLIAGPEPPGNLGAMIKGIKNGKYLSVGTGTARKSIVWAEDIAQIIPRLSMIGGVFNLTDRRHPSFSDLESAIASALKKEKPISIPLFLAKFFGRLGDLIGSKFPLNSEKLNKITSTLTFDDSKACNLLSWKPSSVCEKLEATL